ncbi:unnamed protein product [Periconia digitata]|uniref:DUF6536 domain-containing protein n=1 Tax=Periconia digitata TaxID=1303443 RepID=A0A9W4UPI4_9PLEO|nr:unnamed protein product [Periconia digitata]
MLPFDAILHPRQKQKYVSIDDDLPAPARPEKRTFQTSKSRQGWRFGAVNCAIAATVVFLVNLIMTIVCATFEGDHEGTLYVGDCEKVKQINKGMHILINILSTVLLSSSNYCMQCLSAPTRRDIDVAHAKGKWMDIGVLSVRNLRRISKKRVMLWALLGLSSLPLHLFYNSTIYMSISAFEYRVAAVGQSFVDNPDCKGCSTILDRTAVDLANNTKPDRGTSCGFYNIKNGTAFNIAVASLHEKAHTGLLDRIEPIDCINQYGQMIQSKHGSLILVFRDEDVPSVRDECMSANSPVFFAAETKEPGVDYIDVPYHWICPTAQINNSPGCDGQMDLDKVKQSPANWTVGFYPCSDGDNSRYTTCSRNSRGPIQYCLSEKVEARCELRWSIAIAVVVILLNAFKACLIFYTAFHIDENPLMAVGDAIVSFLQTPDPTTVNMCLSSQKDFTRVGDTFSAGPRRWDNKRYQWRHSVSRTRRAVTFLMMSIAIGVVIGLLLMGLYNLTGVDKTSLVSIARIGFGALDPRQFIGLGFNDVLRNTLVVNSGQVIVSFIYFSYNGLFTCMLLGYEWASYSSERKGLRITAKAKGAQRSTYFLSLPYRFGLPLMATSSLLHWLVSQSIFFVSIDRYDVDGKYTKTESTCGYSNIAIIAVIAVSVAMLLFVIGIGFIPYKEGTIMVGSCSAAVSAACHPMSKNIKGEDLVCRKLQWGVVGQRSDGVGHCTFTDGQVEPLIKENMYAAGS